MITVDQLLALRGVDLDVALKLTRASADQREPITGYQGLTALDVIKAPNGVRIYVRGDDVVLIYAGRSVLQGQLTDEELAAAVGSAGEELRSRQGKRALLHVAAESGIAWSELDGVVGFVELFPPTDLATYQREIYREPPRFVN